MKNKSTLSIIVTMLTLLTSTYYFTSCTKEGPEGKPGLDGIDGNDGAQSCGSCHNMSEFLKAKINQYSNSVHAQGANTNRSDAECSRCHTSIGFRNYISGVPAEAIENATPINCRTCHPIHETYTTDDFVLRTTDTVALMVGNFTYNYGTSNICVNCHQARPVDPYPNLTGDSVKITNARYGPHHATQANMLTGRGIVQIPGSMPYLNSAHTKMVTNGCVTCHMSPATGILAGGHQMNVSYSTSSGQVSYQFTGCYATDCHGSSAEITAMITPNREEIKGLIEQLKDRLIEKGLLNTKELVPVPITISQKEAAVIMNYEFIVGDHSYGAHNYRLTKAILTNAIESLE